MENDAEHFFTFLFAICISFLVKCSRFLLVFFLISCFRLTFKKNINSDNIPCLSFPPTSPLFLSLFSNQFFFLVHLQRVFTKCLYLWKLNSYEVIQYNCHPRNFPHAPSSYSPPPLLPPQSNQCSAFFSTTDFACYKWNHAKCILLCNPSLFNMVWRFIHLACIRTSFLFIVG